MSRPHAGAGVAGPAAASGDARHEAVDAAEREVVDASEREVMDAAEREVMDAAERGVALDPRRSFIVQAPAGSGKTELLIRRYAALLPTVEKPEEILAITFTRKAAAEMRARVLARLGGAGGLAHRIRIQTIDAFCAALTRRMPVVARFGAQPGVAEDATELCQEAAARTLATFDDDAARLLAHLDNDVAAATALLAAVLARRDRWRGRTGAPTRAELEAALAAERARLLDRARARLPDASPELAAELLTKAGAWRKRHARAQALAGDEPLRIALVALLDLPPPAYTERQWQALGAILALLPRALLSLFEVFQSRGQVDFTEVALGAIAALGEPESPTDLLLALDTRIRHVLVDEFQDTSRAQWALLERLTAGWEPGDGRTVFAVGDPMQSVYRFRDAEVALFLQAWESGLPNVRLEPLRLKTNFRSEAGVVGWVNGFFARALPAVADPPAGAVPYAASVAQRAAGAGEAVRWHAFASREDEAARVAELCRQPEGRAAILVRNRTHLDHIVPALRAAGIAFRAVDIEPLGERPVVQDLHALARALAHLGDRAAWLAVLRAPWCGTGLDTLAALVEGAANRTVWDLVQDADARLTARGVLATHDRAALARVREALAPAIAHRLRGTLRDAVEGAWHALGGPACLREASSLADAEAFLDELERLEVAGALEDDAALAASLESLYARPDAAAPEDAVQILTIHKAKGLEFDTVIVPGLDRAPRAADRALFAWRTTAEGGLLLAPIDETGAGRDPIYRYVRELDREAEDLEAGRLFYVAATRAIRRLHLLGCATRDAEGALRRPAKRSFLALAWPEAAAHFEAAGACPAVPGPATAAPLAPREDVLWRLPAGFVRPPAPSAPAWDAPAEAPGGDAPIEFSWAGELARHVGTVVHRWLQRMAEDALEGWSPARVVALGDRFAAELERLGVQPADLGAASARVAEALENAIADARGRWILGPHAQARNELRLRGARGRSVRIDRCFTDADGTRWVVDYKTSRQEGSGVDLFLDRERERYRAQLERYGALVPGGRLGLYFPAMKAWREVG